MGFSPCFDYCNESLNMDDFISETDDFLTPHPIGSDRQGDHRQTALQLKDLKEDREYKI